MLPDGEKWLVEGLDHFFITVVDTWPLIQIELKVENFRIKQRLNQYTLLQKNRHILGKHKATDEPVLVLTDVLYNNLDSSNLIVPQSIINRISIKVLFIFARSLLDFIPIEKWVLITEEFGELVIE